MITAITVVVIKETRGRDLTVSTTDAPPEQQQETPVASTNRV